MCPSDRHVSYSSTPTAAAFSVLDADNDGRISPSDLKSVLNSGDEVISSMMTAADSDRNGFVDLEEFERVLLPESGNELMKEMFRVMDTDGDGKVGFVDLKLFLDRAGVVLCDEEVRMMIRMSGEDESDGIGFDGFVKILTVDFGL